MTLTPETLEELERVLAEDVKVFVFIQHGDGVGAELVTCNHASLRTMFIDSMWCGDHGDIPEEIEREANIVGDPEHEEWGGFPRQVSFSYEDGHIQIVELTNPQTLTALVDEVRRLRDADYEYRQSAELNIAALRSERDAALEAQDGLQEALGIIAMASGMPLGNPEGVLRSINKDAKMALQRAASLTGKGGE